MEESFFCDWARWLVSFFEAEFQAKECTAHVPGELLINHGQKGSAIATRILALEHNGKEVGRMRITLVDAGAQIQAINAAVYPSHHLGLTPMLGVDVLNLSGGKRLLFGTDWAPLLPDEEYQEEHITRFLAAWREKHIALIEEPSTRFYGEEPEFFSKCIFFSRPESPEQLKAGSALWDVFQGYCERYSSRLKSAARDESTVELQELASRRQEAYDQWHAERDPAVAVFKGLFGQDWTERFIKTVLFPGANSPFS